MTTTKINPNLIAYISEFENDMTPIYEEFSDFEFEKISSKSKSPDNKSIGVIVNSCVYGGNSIPLVSSTSAMKYGLKHPKKPVMLVLDDKEYFQSNNKDTYDRLKKFQNIIIADVDELSDAVKLFKNYKPPETSYKPRKGVQNMPPMRFGKAL